MTLTLALLSACLFQDKPPAPPADPPPPPAAQGPVVKSPIQELTIGGQIRLRGEYRDPVLYTDTPASRDDDDLFLSRIRLNLKALVTPDLEIFLQPQDQRTFGDEASVLNDEQNLDVHQGYVEIRNLLDAPLSIRGGRMELQYGDQRLISPLDWHNVARAWDGVRVRYAPKGFGWIDGFATVIREGTGAEDDHDFYGLYASCTAVEAHEFDLYLLGREFNDNTFTSETGLAGGDLRDATFGVRVKGRLSVFDYTAEGMIQTGHWSTDDVDAHAFAGTLGINLDLPWKPRLGVEVTFASGDADPTDGDRETFDPLFPFQHTYQGFADVFAFKNGQDIVVNLKVVPAEGFSVHVDFHTFELDEEKDAWYNAAGAVIRRDATGAADPSVGQELDLHARLAVGKYVSFWGGWSHFFAGEFVEDTPGTDRDMDWFFLQMVVGF